jgi:2-hydroxy-3-oxopropionate reductase
LTAAAARSYELIEEELGSADHAAALLALERINPGLRVGVAPDVLP